MPRFPTPVAAAFIALMVLCGCKDKVDHQAAKDSRYAEPAIDGEPAAAPAGIADVVPAIAAAGTDERAALGVLNAINEHEISAGQQALEKGVRGKLAEFATLMVSEHTDNRDKTLALNPDAESAPAVAMRAKGVTELRTLGEHSGDAYAKAYVEAMVKGHADALATLDDDLIPAATSEPVKQHLAATREHVAHHLELARQLQAGTP